METPDLHGEIEQNAEPEVTYRHPRGSWAYQVAATRHGWVYRWRADLRHPEFCGQATPWGPYRGPWPTSRDDATAAAVRHIADFLKHSNAARALIDPLYATTHDTLF